MTFGGAVAWSASRSIVIALLVWPCCRWINDWIDAGSAAWRGIRWAAVLIPALVPELLIGYAYTPWLAGLPSWSEAMCAGLLALRLLPVGVIADRLTPPSPLTASALFLMWTSCSAGQIARGYWHGPVRQAVPTAALLFVLAFQEFELAALLRTVSWTDWLFVAQVGGLSLFDTARLALGPAVLQCGLISIGIACLRRTTGTTRDTASQNRVAASSRLDRSHVAARQRQAALVIVFAWVLLVVIPVAMLLSNLPMGMRQVTGQPLRMVGLVREMAGGLAISVTAACATWVLARWIWNSPRQAFVGLVAVPGLMGSLVLSLVVLTAFQRPALAALYDTPLPWVCGLILFLLPRAGLLHAWWQKSSGTAVAVAEPLWSSNHPPLRRAGQALRWRLVDEPRFAAVACLVYWGYLELTIASLLAPTGLPSGIVRLYNFLHYGRTAALSVEVALLLGGPLLIAGLVWLLVRSVRT